MNLPINGQCPPESQNIVRTPTSIERLASVEVDLDKINKLLEHLWVQRHMLYSAIREIKTVQRNIELAKKGLVAKGGSP